MALQREPAPQLPTLSPWRLSVAPMMDWTDRHCRYMHRLITRHTLLYTEMVTSGALLHGDVARHLQFNEQEHPVALQLGGSEPADLAHCARLAEHWGYDEVNLNCGCPSERVQRGAFGACLMAEPQLVADCVAAMRAATRLPVTVKHRIGIDKIESYAFVRDFVGTVAERGGCEVFIVHARNAWLKGLSPKQNREVPPLRYSFVRQLKQDFPSLTIVVNGGLDSNESVAAQLVPTPAGEHPGSLGLPALDGAMLGRWAYHQPWAMAQWDALFWGRGSQAADVRPAASGGDALDAVEDAYVAYLEQLHCQGQDWRHAARHMLGLRHGQMGSRLWRQVWSEPANRTRTPRQVQALARAALRSATHREVQTL